MVSSLVNISQVQKEQQLYQVLHQAGILLQKLQHRKDTTLIRYQVKMWK